VLRVLSLRDYNTRVVVLGTMLLGLAAGFVGSFMLLHKQALLGDALSHATLPGIGLAFIFGVLMGGSGKSLAWLLTGAVVTGLIGIGCILLILHFTRLKQDTALGIVLSVFFGAGVAVLGVIQKMQTGSAAGLESFIYGKTASMRATDAWLIAATAAIVILGCIVLLKEFLQICFDSGYARAQGWPVVWLDILLMSMVTAVTVIGLQAVGLILIVALLIIPPAAARFWTDRLVPMLLIAAGIGACSAAIGAGASAVVPNLPSGAMIVVVASGLFLVSMIFAPARGVLVRTLERVRLHRRISRQNLLRAMFEHAEPAAKKRAAASATNVTMSFAELLEARSWTLQQLGKALRSARDDGLVREVETATYALTPAGAADAARLTRNHRLWELYLIHFADVAPNHVDRDAEEVEHVLGRDMIEHLEGLLAAEPRVVRPDEVPESPHG
jgi:manganese/zinc/iron transport system permease protein